MQVDLKPGEHVGAADVMTPIDVEIDRVTKAVLRVEVAIDEMSERARGGCCPSCVFGYRWTATTGRQERQLAWLRVLLLKRGTAADGARAEAILADAWP